MYTEHDCQQAKQLLHELERAWSSMVAPVLPLNLQWDFELGRYYKYIADKKWGDIDVMHPKLFNECWLFLLPNSSQLYYLASFLSYCLSFFGDHWQDFDETYADAELPFLCAIDATINIGKRDSTATDEQRTCVFKIMQFIHDHLPCYGHNYPDVADRVVIAIAVWNPTRADKRDRGAL